MRCYECDFEAVNAKGLSYHVRIEHEKAYPDYLVEHEMGGVWPTCKCGCGTLVRFLCGKFCEHAKGHQSIGLKRSEETRKKISDAQLGRLQSDVSNAKRSVTMTKTHAARPELREFIRNVRTGTKASEETKQRISEVRTAKIASGEIVINRDKISETVTQRYLDGGFAWCKGSYVSSKTGKTIFYRSSWELAYARLLDADGSVASWDHEPFTIEYTHLGRKKRYLPDFLVHYVDKKCLVEVKPARLRSNPVNVSKSVAARAFCASRGWEYLDWDLDESIP